MKPHLPHVASAVALLLACGTSTPAPTDATTADSAMAVDVQPDVQPDLGPPDTDRGYPPMPYGPNIGDTLPNFTFRGFWAPTRTMGLATTEMYGDVTFEMVRRSGARYAVVELGAFW